MTNRHQVKEIVEFLFLPQNTLSCISEKLSHGEVILPRAWKKKSRSNCLWKSSSICYHCFAKQMLKNLSGSCEGKGEGEVEGRMLLLPSLHLICNDGSKTDDQQLLPFFHHLVFHIKSHVRSCQPFTSLFNSSCPFLTHRTKIDDLQLKV